MRRSLNLLFLLTTVLSGGLLALIGPTPEQAAAHPLGNFTINRYARIEVYGDALVVHYVVDFAEIPTFQLMPTIDSDGNGEASSGELSAFLESLQGQIADHLAVSLGDQVVDLRRLSGDALMLPGEAGLEILRMTAVFSGPVTPTDAPMVVQFSDQNYAERLGWKEIVVSIADGVVADVDPALTRDVSKGLREYPEITVSSAPSMSHVTFEWTPGPGTPAPAIQRASVSDELPAQSRSGFEALIDGGGSIGMLFVSLIAAFGFGALHALGPGHGKAVVAAYLVGSKGTVGHAVALGLTVTATHTSMVYLLGFVTIAASAFVVPERVYQYLALVSGASVALMGVALFVSRSGLWRRGSASNGEHRHGLFGQTHSHGPHTTANSDSPDAGEGHGHVHPQSPPSDSGRVTWRSLITLGMLGGMLPCPSALVVMLAAVALNKAVYGMLLIVAFSVGLASVLMAIGVVLVTSRRLSANASMLSALRRPAIARFTTAIPAISALGIAFAGALITFQAMRGL